MRSLLLPGEKEELALHPSPASWLPRYGAALLFAAWGAALWWLLDAYWPSSHPRYDLVTAHLLSMSGFMAAGAAVAWVRASWRGFWALAATGVAVSAVSLLWGIAFAASLPLLAAAPSIPAILAVELDRRLHTYRLTNLRVVGRDGLLRRAEWTFHYADLKDLDTRQGPLGRMLGFGTLVPVVDDAGAPAAKAPDGPGPETRQLRGVAPLAKVRALLEALIQDATATQYLRQAARLDRKVADALTALHRRR